ncbi:MAG: hypothetical protein FJX77_09985, partial [Armatimonadetes bacterium]|nr:hypothetical protein [Armatimonadota bacterium]
MSPRILLLSLLLSGSLMVGPAQAHPLGNFTVNHFTRLEPDRNEIRLRHVVDLAEIPTLKELSRKGWAPGSGREPSYAELEQYATDELEPTGRGLALEVDGRPVPIPGRTARAVLQEGQGGLKTLRLEYDLVAPLTGRPDQARQVLLTDR